MSDKLYTLTSFREAWPELMRSAIAIREKAHAPYPRFRVGADGSIHSGCNVENVSYGLTICAERSAVCAAVSAGCQEIVAIAVATSGEPVFQCGACLQVIREFAFQQFGPETG